MALIICCCCGRQRNVATVNKGKLRCSNCGASAARVIRRIRVWMNTADNDGVSPETARHATYARLKYYAEEKGYKPGWVGMKFKMLFGCWPNGESVEEAQAPTEHLMKWFWKQASEYSKQMRKREFAAQPSSKPPEKESELMRPEDWEVDL